MILLILQWLCYILLGILALLLLILLAVLFIPLQYDVSIEKEEELHYQVHIYWLFHFLAVNINTTESKIRILGIPIWSADSEEQQSEESSHKTEPPSKDSNATSQKETTQEETTQEETTQEETTQEETTQEETTQEDKSFHRKQHKKQKEACKKTKKMKHSHKKQQPIAEYLKSLTGKERVELVTATLQFVKRILLHLSPSHFSLYLVIGTEDPATTGKLLGILALLSYLCPGSIEAEGNFQQPAFQCKTRVKGKIVFFSFIWTSLCYITNKTIWKSIRWYWKG